MELEKAAPRALCSAWALASSVLVAGLGLPTEAAAQQRDGAVEEIVVTGSYIRRAREDAPSPIQNVDREQLVNTGLPGVGDVIKTLSSISGVENDSDQGQTVSGVGAANVNLRGLGLNTTLVLINGKRSTLAATSANDGSSFVDINQLPMIMIDNIEILKDGAAALYGSDAVAGVANFKTRNDFEGFEVVLSHQETSRSDDQSDTDIGVIWGFGNDRTHFVIGGNYFERDPLHTRDRDFAEYPLADFTPFFRPTDFPVLTGDGTVPLLIDSNCTAAGGFRDANFDGLCYGNFNPSRDIFAKERRKQLLATWTHDLDGRHSLYGEIGWSETGIVALGNSPSLPVTTFLPFTADNPGAQAEMAAQGIDPASIDQLLFWGIIRNNEENLASPYGRSEGSNLYDSRRFVIGAEGELTDSWRYDVSYNYSESRYTLNGRDTLTTRLRDALNGFGMCDRNAPGAAPGVGDCRWFNPFGNSILAEPGSPLYNSPELTQWMEDDVILDSESSLTVWDLVLTRDALFEMPAGAVGLAVGAQYRDAHVASKPDSRVQEGQFVFSSVNTPYRGTQDVWAAFAELAIPLTDDIEMQVAARYEDYGGQIGDTLDPKVAVRWAVTDQLALRASAGTSFRAPTILQTSSRSTGLEFISAGGAFGRIPTFGNPELTPEEAVNFNFGVIWEPTENLSLIVDYWYYDYDDIIVQENAQGIAADCIAAYTAIYPVGTVGGNSLDIPACAYRNVIVEPLSRGVQSVDRTYQNASSVKTDGIDLLANYVLPTRLGEFGAQLNWAYLNRYDLVPIERPFATEPQGTVDAVGRRNHDNFARSLPEHKGNLVLSWLSPGASHYGALTLRYVDEVEFDDPAAVAAGMGVIDDHLTLDLLYQYDFSLTGSQSMTFALGVVNLTNEDPPEAFLFNGYDSTLHDPRGRMVYGKISYSL